VQDLSPHPAARFARVDPPPPGRAIAYDWKDPLRPRFARPPPPQGGRKAVALSTQISQSKRCWKSAVKEPQLPSPLVGEVGARSAPGGGLSSICDSPAPPGEGHGALGELRALHPDSLVKQPTRRARWSWRAGCALFVFSVPRSEGSEAPGSAGAERRTQVTRPRDRIHLRIAGDDRPDTPAGAPLGASLRICRSRDRAFCQDHLRSWPSASSWREGRSALQTGPRAARVRHACRPQGPHLAPLLRMPPEAPLMSEPWNEA
jgi:hypothetical protein